MTRCEPLGAFGEGRLLPLMFCNDCDGTDGVEPMSDPWGCFNGLYLCESCIDSRQDGASHDCFERAMEAAYPLRDGTERY